MAAPSLAVQIVKAMREKYGAESAGSVGSAPIVSDVVGTISTGSYLLDAISGGGIPIGRITEIFGGESAGKSTVALSLLRNAQRQGGIAVLVDTENSFNRNWAKQIGVDMDNLIISQPEHAEATIEYINHVLEVNASIRSKDTPLLILWDSVAASPTIRELEADSSEPSAMAEMARLMSRAMRQIGGKLPKHNAALVLINQIRDRVGVMFGDKTLTPGGRAVKFHASLRVKIERIKTLKSGTNALGIQCKVTVVKSKLCSPFRSVEFPIIFSSGLDDLRSLVEFGVTHNLLTRKRNGEVLYNGKPIQVTTNKEYLKAVLGSLDASVEIPDAKDVEEEMLT